MRAPSAPAALRSSALPVASVLADYLMMSLAVILGGGSIVLFAWAGRPALVPMGLASRDALGWDALLSCLFFAQHSVLVRRSVRARLSAFIPARYDGASYAISSGVALTMFAVLFQPVEPPLFVLRGLARAVLSAVALLAVAGLVWSAAALRSFDPLGLRPIRNHLRRVPAGESPFKPFVVRGPYGFVRHPVYFFIIVLLWASPDMSASRLTVAVLWSAWIVVGARLEERDLTTEFGDTYRQYRRQVPFLFPWRGRVRVGSVSSRPGGGSVTI